MKQNALENLTVEEKLRLLCSDGFWFTYDCNGKIPKVAVADGPIGLRAVRKDENGKEYTVSSVAYPCTQILANTWNVELAREMGECLADDCYERNVDVLLGPGINIKRHPLNGRNFEYFSEDPYLAGMMGKSYIDGLQSQGIGACVKHFCCNNLEYNRFEQSSEVDERTLREIYYRPFEIACEADPVSVMSAYNRVNGVYASENEVAFTVLRKEFGFDGVIYSDWEAVRDRTAAAKAGCDIEFPFNQANYDKLLSDYKSGLITDAEIDACVKRILHFVYQCKDMQEGKGIKRSVNLRLQTAKTIAEEGMVLLKNEGVLPLNNCDRIAVCGCYATPERKMISGDGAAQVVGLHEDWDLPKSLAERSGAKITYEPMFWYDKVSGARAGFAWTARPYRGIENAKNADVSIICVGTGSMFEYESADRDTMRLPKVQERAIFDLAKVNKKTIVVIFAGSAIDVSAWEDKVQGIVYAGFCGEQGFEALADILCGKANPSGKLSESFPVQYESTPVADTYIDTAVTKYEEGLEVGYRYYDRHPEKVKYPFGFGLSYSQFVYSDMSVEEKNGERIVEFVIKNASTVDGKEIAQIYVAEEAPEVFRPMKELKGFAKVALKAGECKCVTVRLNKRAFSYYSASEKAWRVKGGRYRILVGASSADMRLEKVIEI